jgi:hypothetical protein
VQTACREAWQRSGLAKRVTAHSLRHYAASRTMPRGSKRTGLRPSEYRGCLRASHLTCGIVRRLGIRVV